MSLTISYWKRGGLLLLWLILHYGLAMCKDYIYLFLDVTQLYSVLEAKNRKRQLWVKVTNWFYHQKLPCFTYLCYFVSRRGTSLAFLLYGYQTHGNRIWPHVTENILLHSHVRHSCLTNCKGKCHNVYRGSYGCRRWPNRKHKIR